MPRVLVTPFMLYESTGPYRDVLERAGFQVEFVPGNRPLRTPGELLGFLVERKIEAVLASMEPFTREVLEGSGLKVIARMGVGYDAIDVPAATDAGVAVTITPGTNDVSVAEMTIVLLLGVFRGFPARELEVRSDRRDLQQVRSGRCRFKGGKTDLPGLPDSQTDVGGWDEYPQVHSPADWDTDGDGLPDDWETARGLDPHDPTDGHAGGRGDRYTNLEEYLGQLGGEFADVPQ